jgi:gas vesicle protein
MDNGEKFATEFLKHYSSEYYDPAKAREYYLRTRELKGRSSSKLKTEDQKAGWEYAKSGIDEAKKTELTTTAQDHKKDLEGIRQTANERRVELRDAVKSILEALTLGREDDLAAIDEDTQTKLEKITKDAQAKLDALPKLPKRSSDVARAARAEKIAKIRGDARTETGDVLEKAQEKKTDVSETVSGQKGSVKDSAVSVREDIGIEMKATIDSAREAYNTLKEELKAKYEAVYQNEYESIKTNV